MIRTKRAAAVSQGLLANPDRRGQFTARGQVGGVVDADRQGKWMQVAVGAD
jgi:hypothetical protein